MQFKRSYWKKPRRRPGRAMLGTMVILLGLLLNTFVVVRLTMLPGLLLACVVFTLFAVLVEILLIFSVKSP